MKWAKNLGRFLAGSLLGLCVAEGAFWWRDDGAFPHVNLYVEDPQLGVRLLPNQSERVAFGGNPSTIFHTNSAGYRVPDWPEDPAVLVVGDSQVFGLGVGDQDTSPAALASLLNRPVINGGVPTYGPEEYLAVVEEISRKQPITHAVVVINFANDLFELSRPNRDRHRVWDGWAIRAEYAPSDWVRFPGRAWIMSQSHLMFAARKLLYTNTTPSNGVPSEGSASDLLRTVAHTAQPTEIDAQQIRQQDVYMAKIRELGDPTKLGTLFQKLGIGASNQADLKLQAAEEGRGIGDIVGNHYAESSRSIVVTAEILREGAQIRHALPAKLSAYLRENPDGYLSDEVRAALRDTKPLDPMVATEIITTPHHPFEDYLDRLLALAAERNFEPILVTLPLDVMVDADQFRKYGSEPIDMAPTLALLHDLSQVATQRGIRVASPLTALQAIADEAFLHGDLHLTPAGHVAVATTIQHTLESPAPIPTPRPGIPPGRSRIPWRAEWASVKENLVIGSTRNHCQTRKIREWFRMDCHSRRGSFRGIRFTDAPTEAFGYTNGSYLVFYTPLLPGRDLTIDLAWPDRQQRFTATWAGESVRLEMTPRDGFALPKGRPITLDQGRPEVFTAGPHFMRSRFEFYGAGKSCAAGPSFVDCALGHRNAPPSCPPGWVNAGSAAHCLQLCAQETPCEQGRCGDWNGGKVCL